MLNLNCRALTALGVGAAVMMVAAAPALAGGEGWVHDDMDKAMKQAKAENKDILVDFTGSDWCYWCKKLDGEVFSQSEFKESVPSKFVLVALDFPSDKVPQTEEIKAHNKKWAEKMEVRGYPTIVLMDAEGKAYAKTGYREGGPGPYIEHLNKLQEGKALRDKTMKAAKAAEGLERAKLLDQALSIEDIIVEDRADHMRTIIALDAEDTAGLKSKYEAQLRSLELENAMQKVQKLAGEQKFDEALAEISRVESQYELDAEETVQWTQMHFYMLMEGGREAEANAVLAKALERDDLSGEQKQMLASARIGVAMNKGDTAGAIKAAKEIIEIAPDSDFSEQIRQFIKRMEGAAEQEG